MKYEGAHPADTGLVSYEFCRFPYFLANVNRAKEKIVEMEGWMREINFTTTQVYTHLRQHRNELKCTHGTVVLASVYLGHF